MLRDKLSICGIRIRLGEIRSMLSYPTKLFLWFGLFYCVAGEVYLTARCFAGNAAGIFGLLFSSCFLGCGVGIFLMSVKVSHTRQLLHIGQRNYGMWDELCLWNKDPHKQYQEELGTSRVLGETCKLSFVELVPHKDCNTCNDWTSEGAFIRIREGFKEHEFGSGVDIVELQWIADEVNKIINQAKSCSEFF